MSGTKVETIYHQKGKDSRLCFAKFNNGEYNSDIIQSGIRTKHPNILKGLIIGKKSWGLFVNEWSDGISEGLFTLNEIINEFKKHDIIIPKNLLNDFNNCIYKKRCEILNNF